jgi:hypothetical protein
MHLFGDLVVPSLTFRLRHLFIVCIFCFDCCESEEGYCFRYFAGFFPEDVDDLVLKYVYPSFSPTIGVFLLGSSLYGLYKYLGGPKIKS